MAPERIAHPQDMPETRVLPFRGGEGQMPSTLLVRQALESPGTVRELVRSGMAVAFVLGEHGFVERALEIDGGGDVAELALRTGLTTVEVSGSLQTLEAAGLLALRGDRLRLDADLFCTLPALAEVNWVDARSRIRETGGRLAPALALLRELARRTRRGSDGAGEWLQPVVQELVEETLYGRTAVTQALGDLVRAGLVLKASQAPRSGLRIRLLARTFGSAVSEGAGASVRRENVAEQGVEVQLGGATIRVPAGARLELPTGMNYRLEIGSDGRPILRIDD